MAVTTKFFGTLIVLLLCQHSVGSPVADPQNLWISIQAAIAFDDFSQDQPVDSNQEGKIDVASTTPKAPTTTVAQTTTEAPTTTELAPTTTRTTTTTIKTSACNPSTDFSNPATTQSYKMFNLLPTDIELLRLGQNSCSEEVTDFESCKQIASDGGFGSFAFLTAEMKCIMSSYWRQEHLIPVTNSSTVQEVNFLERDDGEKCYVPNLELLDSGLVVVLGPKHYEELNVKFNKSDCLTFAFLCAKGKLTKFDGRLTFTYVKELDKCIHARSFETPSSLDDIQRFCSINAGMIYNVQNEEEQAQFFAWAAKRPEGSQMAYDMIIDVQYDLEDKLFKWKETGLPVDETYWREGYPVNSEANQCVQVPLGGMVNVPCDEIKNVFCILQERETG